MRFLLNLPAWFLLFFTPSFLLMGCGSPPIIQQQKLIHSPAQKVSKIYFFYQDVALENTTLYKKGSVEFSRNETGLYQFAEILVDRIKPIFEKQGLIVSHASVVPPNEWKQYSLKILSMVPASEIHTSHLLIVSPEKGSGYANHNASRISFLFKVRLIEGSSSSILWEGLVDTETWRGKDFINKNIEGYKFNSTYADLFLAQILDSLRKNNLL